MVDSPDITMSEYESASSPSAVFGGSIELLVQRGVSDNAGMDRLTRSMSLSYLALGLAGEAGEVANKVKKVLRDSDGEVPSEVATALLDECGDVLWYLAQLSSALGGSLGVCASMNVEKLRSRMERGVVRGDGDER